MSDEQSKFPRRPATIFNDFKFDMPKTTKPVEGAKFPATWTWEIGTTGKIMFKVNDGIFGRDDRNAKNKEIELSVFNRNQLLFVLEQAATDKEFKSTQVIVRDRIWNNQMNRMNDTPSVIATFTVARNKNGEIKVNYVRGSYEVTFNMTSSLMQMKSKNSESGEVEENAGLASRAYTFTFVQFSRKFLDNEEWNRYSREPKKGNGNGGGNRNGGGNNNWNNNNGGGNSSSNQPSQKDFEDEDFDF